MCLILPALYTWPKPFRNPHTTSHWLCPNNWLHYRAALDPPESRCRHRLPDSGSNVWSELADISRYGGRVCRSIHSPWFGTGRGLWHQYHHCHPGRGKRANHIHKADTSWWFNYFTQSETALIKAHWDPFYQCISLWYRVSQMSTSSSQKSINYLFYKFSYKVKYGGKQSIYF